MPEDPGRFACLRCGEELEYDWMACPRCGWKASDPADDGEDPEEIPPRSGLSGAWVRWAAWLLLGAILLLVSMGLF